MIYYLIKIESKRMVRNKFKMGREFTFVDFFLTVF